MPSVLRVVRACSLALLCLSACALPEEAATGGSGAPLPQAAPGEWIIAADQLGTIQLYRTGNEASLPVVTLGSSETLTLAFDLLEEGVGRPLEITFRHTDRLGREDLLPSEFLTGFERDNLLDYERSGPVVSVPYIHYEYTFPNASIGFEISGNYRAVVSTRDGATLFDIPFYVTEQEADVDLAFGSAIQGGSAGLSIQPAARLRPSPRLDQFDASRFVVCFARNGLSQGIRCAPDPSLIDLALYQFYLPREDVFEPAGPLYQLDLGYLGPNPDVIDVDRAATPPTALLDLDYAEFGGDVRDAVLADAPLIASVYRDVGRASTDAQYVAVRFQYVPPGSRQLARRVYVRGSFNGWRSTPSSELRWVPENGRYEGTVLVKQGSYVYSYAPVPRQTAPLNPPALFTAFVYLNDPRRFTDRLIAVQTAVAR